MAEDPMNDRYLEIRGRREVGVKSRLDSLPSKPRTMGILSRPKTGSNSSSGTTGYRIVVSNLQANVTQEDIKVGIEERFEETIPIHESLLSFYRNYSRTSENC